MPPSAAALPRYTGYTCLAVISHTYCSGMQAERDAGPQGVRARAHAHARTHTHTYTHTHTHTNVCLALVMQVASCSARHVRAAAAAQPAHGAQSLLCTTTDRGMPVASCGLQALPLCLPKSRRLPKLGQLLKSALQHTGVRLPIRCS